MLYVFTRGSPPPMRGKAKCDLALAESHGITPAHAGKSEAPDGYGIGDRDHPRPCGEKAVWDGIKSGVQGSPPPMRGKAS